MSKVSQLLCLLFIAGYSSTHAQTLYSHINGTAWKETLPVNNIMDPGEATIRGILVTLKDAATDEIISSTVTNAAGQYSLDNYNGPGTYYIQYDYPTAGYSLVSQRAGNNDSINSAADPATGITDPFSINTTNDLYGYNLGMTELTNTITHCNFKPSSLTIWNDTFSVPKFPTGAATLNKVTLFVADAACHPMIGVENTGNQSIDADLGFSGRITLSPPTGSSLITNTNLEKLITLASYDGTTDYQGTSGHSWYHLFSSATNARAITSAIQLASYTGSGIVKFPAEAKSTTSITGGGNLETDVETNVGTGFCVTYNYTGVLPVSLKNISVSTDGRQAFLKWITATEYNNQGFAVERSADGKTFTEIGFVNSLSHNGNSAADLNYQYTDKLPLPAISYYRLRQVDIDGKYTYSKVLSINISQGNVYAIYPNPANKFLIINAAEGEEIIISDVSGKRLDVSISETGNQKVIDVSHLNNGNYFLKIISGDQYSISKFTVLH